MATATKTITPKQARKLWVKALRSGKYKQVKGRLMGLRKNGEVGYCCLGVACDIYEQKVGEINNRHWRDDGTMLPQEVQHWLGLRGEGGEYDTHALYELNDQARKGFNYIADRIEKEPKGLIADG